MSVLNLIGNTAKTLGSVATKIKVNSPTVLLISGGVCLVGAVISAHQAGRKVDEVLDIHKQQADNLKDMKEAGEYINENEETIEYTADEYKHDMSSLYLSTAWDLTKLYGPVILGTVGAAACFIGGHKVLAKRLAGMTAAYQTVQTAYMKYRGNVVDIYGDEADKKCLYGKTGIFEEKYHETKIDEKTGEIVNVGKAKTREIDVVNDVKDWRQASPYAVRTDKVKGFTKDWQYNKMWLSGVENIANLKYDLKGYLTLYDVYEALGVVQYLDPRAEKMSHQVGWVKGYGDNDIRFNLAMVPTACYSEDGVTRNLTEVGLIDFNCIGSIWDKLT